MDIFVNVTTLGDRLLANRLCQVLEDARIPVMLEHVEIVENLRRSTGFRLLVPTQSIQIAKRLVDAAATVIFERQRQVAFEAKVAV